MIEKTMKELRETQGKLKELHKFVKAKIEYLADFEETLDDVITDINLLLGFEGEDKWKQL